MKTTIEYTGYPMDDFPKLMIHKNDLDRSDPLIVRFFTPYGGGIAISHNAGFTDVDEWYDEDWSMEDFVPFKGKIIIES